MRGRNNHPISTGRRRTGLLGIALIEVMVALVVLSFGIISIAKLQGDLMASSGHTKARAEAVQLAGRKIEELRNMAVEGDYDALAQDEVESDAITGTNATFTRSWTIGNDTDGRRDILVEVEWSDPKSGTQTVALDSIIAWNDPVVSARVAGDEDEANAFAQPPRGAARMGGTLPDGAPTVAEVEEEEMSIKEWQDGESGPTYLLGVDGDEVVVLMTIEEGSAFSTISGSVYIDNGVNPSISAAAIQVRSSDAVYCNYDNGTIGNLPDGANGNNIKYKYFDYKCWMGARWYGNTAVVYTGSSPPRSCVGDPDVVVADPAHSTSRHPVLSAGRSYRGYRNIGLPELVSSGIGINPATAGYTPQHYTHHNFLLTRLSGQDLNDEGCGDRMELLDPATSPFARQEEQASYTHPGRFFCLSDLGNEPADPFDGDDGSSCPDTLPTGEPPETVISGTISAEGITVSGLTIDEGECGELDGDNFTCTISWRGSTISAGETVDVVLTLESGEDHVVCPHDSMDDNGIITYTVGPTVEAIEGQSFTVRSSVDDCP